MKGIIVFLIFLFLIQTAAAIPKSTSVVVEIQIDPSGIFTRR